MRIVFMYTVTGHIRRHIFMQLGMEAVKAKPSLESLKETEWSKEFEHLMRNRLIMGALRYGTLAEHKAQGGSCYNSISSAVHRMQKYQETGNTEFLVDAANLCMIEFCVGVHPNKHFDAADDKNHAQRRKEK